MARDVSAGGMRLGALVLAAGRGTRFGGHKLAAPLEGRPVLQHVLDTLVLVRPVLTVVVVAQDVGALSGISWHEELRVVNPDPGRGLSSSLRLGLETVTEAEGVDGILVLLGDQPRTTVATLEALMRAMHRAVALGAVAVVPSYAEGGGPNPVLLLKGGFPLVVLVSGDRGLGGLLATMTDRVVSVPVPGSNPDVDTPADLDAMERAARHA